MARFRLSLLAQADLSNILATSAERWGTETKRRYSLTLAAAMRRVAADPEGPATRNCANLLPGSRSFHIRHARVDQGDKVRRPVHVLYYRSVRTGLVEIARILHERMEPSGHLGREEGSD